MVALEILIVLLLGYVIIFNKPIRIEFKVHVEQNATPVVTPVPTSTGPMDKSVFAEMTQEEKDYYEESMGLITALNTVLQGGELPKKKEVKK